MSKDIIVNVDFAEIEARVLASLGTVQPLGDLHRAKAAELYGIAEESVTPEQRRHGKAVNFAEWYGAAPSSLARCRAECATPGSERGSQS